jgi:hypothetical protein
MYVCTALDAVRLLDRLAEDLGPAAHGQDRDVAVVGGADGALEPLGPHPDQVLGDGLRSWQDDQFRIGQIRRSGSPPKLAGLAQRPPLVQVGRTGCAHHDAGGVLVRLAQ